MSIKTIVTAVALFTSMAAFAAVSKPIPAGVTESTDPAKVAAVERHAQEIQAQEKQSLNTSGTGAKKATKHKNKNKKAKKPASKTAS